MDGAMANSLTELKIAPPQMRCEPIPTNLRAHSADIQSAPPIRTINCSGYDYD